MEMLPDSEYPNGMLTDKFIKKALHILFSENADKSKAKYSTYELSLDVGYQIIKYSDAGEIQRQDVLNENNLIIAEPGDTILVYCQESFSLPKNIYARVNTVGQIFMAGFSAENTYVDPGFSGKISITLINNSNRTLTMTKGSPLARVEFIKLSDVPEVTHRGVSGVRGTKVKPSINLEFASSLENAKLPELMEEIKKSITVDAIQKKSVRTDIALSRAYMSLLDEINGIKKKVKRWSWLAAVGLGTASALWIDKLGWSDSIASMFISSESPMNWLVIVINIICSIAATCIYGFLFNKYGKKWK